MDTQRPPTFSAERESANSLISSVPDETRVMEPVVRQGLGVILRQYPLQLLMVGTLLVLTATGTIYATISQKDAENNSSLGIQPSSKFSVQDVTLNGVLRPDTLNLNTIQSLSINGQLRANNSLILAPTTQPTGSNATVGQVYFDRTDNALAYYNGTQFISVAGTNDLDALRSQIAAVNTRVSAIPPVQPIPTAVSIPSDLATLGASNSFTSANNFTAGLTASSLAANTLMTTGNTSLQGSLTVAGSTILGPTTAASLVLASPLTVSSGGTGASSLSADGVVLANGSGPLSTADYTSGGQCLMSPLSGAGAPVFGVCPGGVGSGVNQLNSLIGNVTLANATGVGTTITIDNASTTTKGIASFNTSNFSVTAGVVNTIQNIGITASPTFAGLTANNLTSIPNQNLTLNASGTGNLYLTGYDCSASGGGGKLTVDATGQVMCAADGDTDTTGITTITAGNGITITGVNNTIAAKLATGAGIQAGASGLSLLTTCTTDQVLKYNTTTGWYCANDTGGDGVGISSVNATDSSVTVTGSDSIAVKVRPNSGLSVNATNGLGLLEGCTDGQTLKYTIATQTWACANDTDTDTNTQDGVGATTVGSLITGGTKYAEGGTIGGTTLQFQEADATYAGLMTTNAQTFAGAKTFNGALTAASGLGVIGALTTTGAINGATLSGTALTGSGALTVTSATNTNLTLNASGTGNLYLTGYDCSASGGGGKLTVDATGQVMCAADGDTDTTGITTITAGNGITITGVNNTIAASVRTGFGVQIDSSGIGLADSCLTNEILKRTAGGWACATDTVGTGDGVGATTVGALDGGTVNANGATITGTSLFLQSASATNPGLINTGIQTFAGAKTFNGAVALAGGATATGNFTASGTVNGATISGGTLSAAAVNGLTLSGTALTGSGALVVASATNTNLTLNAAGTGNLYLTGYDCSASGGGGKLTVDATGQVACGADGAGTGVSLSGSATDGSLTKFNASGQIMNSNLAESGITNKALTYTGNAIINANTGFTGNLLDLKLNNISKFSVTDIGALTAAGVIRSNTGFSYNGTSGATTSCSGGQFLQNQVVQGGIVTGGTCATAGGLQGSGTNGQIGVFDVNGALQGSANMLFDGSTASLTLGSSTLIGSLLFHDGTGFKGTIRIASGGLSQNTIYVLPAVSGGVVEICTSAGNCIRNGNLAGDMLYWDGDSWELITNGINGQSLIFCGNTPKWGSGGCPAAITTTAASSVLDNSASTGGNVTSDGGTAVTERGIVYSTTSNPTTANSKVISGSGTGTFTVNLTGLTHSTTYYVRAYAINTNGTAYGNQISFTTMVGYAIGDTGPAGGKVFYDKGLYSSGWRYLESSLSDQGTTYPWGGDTASIPGADGLVIGTGNQNTIDAYTYCSATGCNIYAPQTAYNLVLNGFSDWFLPSRDELNQMYIQRNIIGGFQATSYWSSSECGSYSACSQSFITGAQYSAQEKIDYLRMRAIRAF